MTKKKPTATPTKPVARTMLTTKRKASVSAGECPEEHAAAAPSGTKRPQKWTRGGQGKKIKQGRKTKRGWKTKQGREVD